MEEQKRTLVGALQGATVKAMADGQLYVKIGLDVMHKIIEALEQGEILDRQDKQDLRTVRRIRAGKCVRAGCADYVIMNRKWALKHPEKVEDWREQDDQRA